MKKISVVAARARRFRSDGIGVGVPGRAMTTHMDFTSKS
jgi:hypothetical protein